MLAAEGLDLGLVTGDQGSGHEIGEFGDEDFFGRIAHRGRVIDDERLRMDAL